jgi:hypothetical protein
MASHRSRPAFLLFALLTVLAAAAVAGPPVSSTGPSLPGVTATAVAQPAVPAWDPADLAAILPPATVSPAPSPMALPPCPLPCNPFACHPPHSCKVVFKGCPAVCV